MKFTARIHQMARVVSLLALGCIPGFAGTLTTEEISQIETAFGITLSAQEKTDLGAIAKPDTSPAWRTAAEARIDTHRKATLTVQVEDSVGTPVPSAQVAVKLNKNAFKFSGVVDVQDLTDAAGNLETGFTTNDWKNVVTNLFNAVGLNNGFKQKITSQHTYIPNFLTWSANNNLDVRGHLLMWPGGGHIDAGRNLAGVAGTDYGNHLSTASTSAYATHNVLGAVETWQASADTQADQDALKAEVDAEIKEWVEQWDVYEWDVINETLGNTLIQEILGGYAANNTEEQTKWGPVMADWFKIAETNKVAANTGLYINDFKIISATPNSIDSGTHYTSRKDEYMRRIDSIVSNSGPITGVGFQSRFKYGYIPPDEVYDRLDDFATTYPSLTLAGTEFELKDGQLVAGTNHVYSTLLRAQMTEELMTTYFSHDQVIGLTAWDAMAATTDVSDEKTAALVWYDGTIRLNALVWYYLHRIRYNTDTNDTTDVSGEVAVAGAQKGDYDITVTYNGNDYPATATLSSNQTVVVTLGDVTLTPSANPPVFTVDPISKPSVAENVAYTGQSITNSATDVDLDTITYSKILGPSWLSIAENGDLSGTPTSADVGQNSWIVQASDGFNTDTAVLNITVTGAGGGGGPGSNISIASSSAVQNDDASGNTIFTGISVQAGDMVAISTAPNKTTAVNLLTLSWSGTEGVDGNSSTVNPGDLDGRSCYVFYTQIINGGTYTFTVNAAVSGLTARSKLFVLRANSGNIQVGDTAILNGNTATPGLSYDFSPNTLLSGGSIAIESFAAKNASTLTVDGTYTADENSNGRHIIHSTSVSGSTWSKTHTSAAGALNYVGAGAVFYEQTSGAANTPPVFTSNPVAESGATQDAAYNSSIADNASDADLDSMTFAKVSGPSWLNVATNGALSGTPLVGDLGANSWKVLVTDGTATNFANLEIAVSAPLQIVSPQNGTNILFIAIDDINPVLGCYGDTLAISPNIDSLAASGVTFLNAHCQWSVCGPSRASLMTGLMPEETGVLGFKKMRGDADDAGRVNAVKRPNVVTIPQYFRYNGYRTAATGKINDYRCVGTLNTTTLKVAEDGAAVDDPPSWGDPVDPDALPVDFFSSSAFVQAAAGFNPPGNPSTYSTNLPDSAFVDGIICDEGTNLLHTLAAGDTQFFLGVGFKKPHLAFIAPEQYWNMHTNTPFAIHPFQDHPLHEVSYTWNYAAELANYDDIVDETNVPEAKQLELIHGYYACVSFIDAQVGRLLDELETLGLHTNTIVVLWGDHGFHLGDHAEWAKHTNLEQATRVPFIIHNPFSGQSNVKTETPVALMDIYPTLCEMVGLPIPQQPLAELESPTDPAAGRSLKGQSLAGVVNGTTNSVRTGAVNLYRRSGHNGYAYRTDRYRYTEWVNNAGNVVAERELYDYLLDPMETVNLAGELGYDALMYSFSKAMRKEFDDMKLSGTDIAAAELQGSPAATAPANRFLPVLDGSVTGTNVNLAWPDAVGSTYNVLEKTNLLDSAWSTNQADVAGSPATVPADKEQSFFRIEVSN